jgi:hypothetical protein
LNRSKAGSSAAAVGAGLQTSSTGANTVGSGNAHGKAAAYAKTGARSAQIACEKIIVVAWDSGGDFGVNPVFESTTGERWDIPRAAACGSRHGREV